MGSLAIEEIIPQSFELNAYPNPFNPTTRLSFNIQNESFIQLSIYNISGHLLEVLANQNIQAGNIEVIWDASYYPSGVYFANLNINHDHYTQKLILIK